MGRRRKVLGELADAAVAKGVKQISGDVIGDDSYFPRERYPNGWEIDDMVWEYGAAISAIVVDDNTVALTLTPGEQGQCRAGGGDSRDAGFHVENGSEHFGRGREIAWGAGGEYRGGEGQFAAKSAPRNWSWRLKEPAQHARPP